MKKNNIKNISLFMISFIFWLNACVPSSTNQQQQTQLLGTDLITLAGRKDISNKELSNRVYKYLDKNNYDVEFINTRDDKGARFLHNLAQRKLDNDIYQLLAVILNTLKLSHAQATALNATVIDNGQSHTVLKYFLGALGDRLHSCIALLFKYGARDISPALSKAELNNLLDALQFEGLLEDPLLIAEALSKAATANLAIPMAKWARNHSIANTDDSLVIRDTFKKVYAQQVDPIIKGKMRSGFIRADFKAVNYFTNTFDASFGIKEDLLATDIDLGQGANPLLLSFLNAFMPLVDLKDNGLENSFKRRRFADLVGDLKDSLGPTRRLEWDPYARLSLPEVAAKANGVADAYELLEVENPNLSDIKAMLVDLDDNLSKQVATKNFLFSFLNTASEDDKNALFNRDLSHGQKIFHKLLSLRTNIYIQEIVVELLANGASLAVLGDAPNDFDAKHEKILDMVKFSPAALKQAFDTISPALIAKLTEWSFDELAFKQVRKAWGYWYSNLPNDDDKLAARSHLLSLVYNSERFYWLFHKDFALKTGIASGDLYDLAQASGIGVFKGQLIQVIVARATQDAVTYASEAISKIMDATKIVHNAFVIDEAQWNSLMNDTNFGRDNNLGDDVSIKSLVEAFPCVLPRNKEVFAKAVLLLNLKADDVNNEAYYLVTKEPEGDTSYLELFFRAFQSLNHVLDDLALSKTEDGSTFLENLVKIKATEQTHIMLHEYLYNLTQPFKAVAVRGIISKFLAHGIVDGDEQKFRERMLADLVFVCPDDELNSLSAKELGEVFQVCSEAGILAKNIVNKLAKALKAKFISSTDWHIYLEQKEPNFANRSIVDLVVTETGDIEAAKLWLLY